MESVKDKPAAAAEKRKRSRSPSPPRQRKRPGAASRISNVEKEALQKRQFEREKEQAATIQQAAKQRGIQQGVTNYYNELRQRDRGWRATESKIKNLRSYNNWAKSTLIQRFSPNEDFSPAVGGGPPYAPEGLTVLDIGCGKGGDLQKWQNAPQRVERYIGVDPAEVSIEQARGRYAEMKQRNRRAIRAEFHIKDAYGEWIGDILSIREVGHDPNVGPEVGGSSRWGGGGFDVVSMMFCMHYAFESEAKARGMLRNVSGALKKGGRFMGVIPNSDVIRAKVKDFYKDQATRKQVIKANGEQSTPKDITKYAEDSKDSEDGPTPAGDKEDDKKGEEKGKEKGEEKEDKNEGGKDENKDNVKEENESGQSKEEGQKQKVNSEQVDELPPEWGNDLYRLRFPGKVPEDGVFRPPFGWKYNYFLEEAVEEVPEYIVPWEAFRGLAEDYNLEMQYRKPLPEIWKDERDDPVLGPLSVRMRVTDRNGGELQLSDAELEAVGLYHAFCFYKI
ncbi:mRNA cap guanine-N7 methyltransferase [Thelotrema lepadinum]|nr:mRNA cap guanine-N7 methyltransferase [Thelotrema lepadinum]